MALQCGRCGAGVQDFFASRCPGCGEALAPETLVRNENAPTIVSPPREVEEESFGLPGEGTTEAVEAARTPCWQHAAQAAFGAIFFALGGIYM